MDEKKILIVEDVRAARNLYEQAIIEYNKSYIIKGVDTGTEALRSLKLEKFDLIILDINLPDMRGEEVLEKLRIHNPNIPVLILTAFAQKNVIIKVTKSGINDFLIKPVDLNILRARIESILGGEKEIILKDKLQSKKVEEKPIKKKVEENKYLWQKETVCPVCTCKFQAYHYKSKSQALIEKESDFHEIYELFDPTIYEIIVCPECFYSSFKTHFSDLKIQNIEMLQKKKRESVFNFLEERTNEVGIESINLAIITQEQMENTNNALLGNLYVKKAWLYRNLEDKVHEVEAMVEAILHYEKKYLSGDDISGGLSENAFAYLIAELSRRVGDGVKAQKYFNIVISSKDAKKEKYIYGLAQRQYRLMREEINENNK